MTRIKQSAMRPSLRVAIAGKLETEEKWFHMRMLHISCKDHVTNDDVLSGRGGIERKLMDRIREAKLSFLGLITKKKRLENIIVAGKIEGERDRGRP